MANRFCIQAAPAWSTPRAARAVAAQRAPRRSYAVAVSPKDRDSTASDTRLDLIRRSLYPPNVVSSSSSPTGAQHPQVIERVQHVMAGEHGVRGATAKEAHDTITRAWNLHQKQQAKRRAAALQAKRESMQKACEALRRMSAGGEAVPGARRLYDAAMIRPKANKANNAADSAADKPRVKRSQADTKYYAARLGGLFPREMPVPTETWRTGARWDYEWKHPDKSA